MASLTAVACGGSPAAPSTVTLSTDPKDLAEALLLSSGPLSAPHSGGFGPQEAVGGWPNGSVITVRVSSLLPERARGQIQQVIDRVEEATLGHLHAHTVLTDEIDPAPAPGEITIWGTTDVAAAGCPSGATLCTQAAFSPFIRSGRIIGQPTGNFPHELGHALFAFGHIKNPNVFSPETIMSGGWGLTDRDVGILQSVYRAGLGPGTLRASLVNAGIINP